VEEGAGDLDAPPLPAAQPPDRLVTTLRELDASQLGGDAGGDERARQTMQRRVIAQILLDREIEIEGRLLEDDTHPRQRRGGIAVDRRAEYADRAALIEFMVERLIALRSPNDRYWCWGYSFPWQTRTIVVPRGTPNLVCTSFVANALLDAYEQRQDPRCLSMAVSAAEYILNELYWTDGNAVVSFAYPLPSTRSQIHNANLLAAALLCRVYRHTGEEKFLGPALKAARCSAGKQMADGSWNYGEAASQQWIDNFHTGYNLCALQSINRYSETSEFESNIQRGLKFYRTHFFREDGAPRYYHNRTYPIDIHCVAQSIITLLAFRDSDPQNELLARSVLKWAMEHMWSDRGFFYYRVLRSCTIRTSYMRWSQAWMLVALSTLLCESDSEVKDPRNVAAGTVA